MICYSRKKSVSHVRAIRSENIIFHSKASATFANIGRKMVDSRKYICSGKQRTMNWVKSVEYFGRISVTNKSQLRCYWIEEESLLEWRFSFHIQSSNRNIVLIFLSLSLFLSFLVSVPAPSFSIFLFIFFLLPFLQSSGYFLHSFQVYVTFQFDCHWPSY